MALTLRFSAGARLFAGFAALSLLPVLALGSLLAVQFRHEVQQRGIAEGRAQAEVIARVLGETQLQGHSLESGLTAPERRRLAAFSAAEVRGGYVSRLRVRAPDQRVIFSDDGSGLPVTHADPPELEVSAALTGRSEGAITRLNDDANDTGPLGPRVIEVYTPLRSPRTGAPTGVLEIYLPYEGIADQLSVGLHRLYLVIGAGLGLLYLVLAGLSAGMGRRLSRHAAEFEHLAMHDPLTDLPNRTLFADRIGQAIAAVQRFGGGAAVVLIDLDRFREVNDTLGHQNGDRLLICLADRLRDSVRAVDTVARLGGDEFGLVLPGVADQAQLVPALARILAAIDQEVDLGGLPLSVEASLGVVFIPQDGGDPDLLMRHADVAMYVAKRSHGGVVCYDDSQDHYNAERLSLVADLRRAVQRDELVLHYQPQIRQPSGQVTTLEALVRWQHPTRGLLSPDEFVPIAEQTGLIDDLTRWVLDAALAQLKQWRLTIPELVVAVNISARCLQQLDFPVKVLDALTRAGATSEWLLLEITETALVTDAASAAMVLGHLSAAGLRLSIDDFGQGYTSLGQLSELPLDELKIDKSFVLNMANSTSDAAIVRSVIDLGHNLGMDVVAEGVENAEVMGLLLDLGCDVTQGFWFSQPLPADQVANWIAHHAVQAYPAGRPAAIQPAAGHAS